MKNGTSLRKVSSLDLYDVAFYLMDVRATMYEDQHEAIQALHRRITDAIFENETGMPAVSRWMPSADQLVAGATPSNGT